MSESITAAPFEGEDVQGWIDRIHSIVSDHFLKWGGIPISLFFLGKLNNGFAQFSTILKGYDPVEDQEQMVMDIRANLKTHGAFAVVFCLQVKGVLSQEGEDSEDTTMVGMANDETAKVLGDQFNGFHSHIEIVGADPQNRVWVQNESVLIEGRMALSNPFTLLDSVALDG